MKALIVTIVGFVVVEEVWVKVFFPLVLVFVVVVSGCGRDGISVVVVSGCGRDGISVCGSG